jgi:two-component system, response regulator YesN
MALYAVGYQSLMTVIQQQMEKNNIAILAQNKLVIEQQFKEISGFSQNIRHDIRVVYFQSINEPFGGKNTFKSYDLLQELKSIQIPNSIIYSYALLYKNSGTAFAEYTVWNLQDFFDKYYRFKGMDYDSWLQLLFGKYHINTILPSTELTVTKGNNIQKINVIPYIYTLNDYQLNNNNALLVMIDAGKINSVLQGIDLSGGGYVLIKDKNNNIITATTSDYDSSIMRDMHFSGDNGIFIQNIAGKKMMVTYNVSPETGWQYISVQPYSIIMAGLSTIKTLIFLAIGLYLAIGLVLSYFLTRRNTAPVFGIIDALKHTVHDKQIEGKANPFAYIKYYMEQLNDENSKYRTEIEKQKPLIIITFFERLLNGNYASHEEMLANAKYAGIALHGSFFSVALLSVEEINSLPDSADMDIINKRKEAIIKCIMNLGFEKVYLHNINTSRLALIISMNEGDPSEIKGCLESLLNSVASNITSIHSFPLYITAGGIYESAFMLSRSYSEALNIMENHVWNFDSCQKLLFYSDYSKSSPALLYTGDTENALLKAVKSGDCDMAGMILESSLGLHTSQPGNAIRLNLYEIISMINRTINEILVADVTSDSASLKKAQSGIINIDLSISVERLYMQALDSIRILCSHYYIKLNNKNKVLIELVKKMIDEQYSSQDLCLQQVADSLSISISYLSRLFKDSTDENFANYVETIRIEKAKHLLRETKMSINEIADAVGYGSANSFARAFKRINNITASDYRSI